ncbi:MAG TPA: hypothetical protein PLL10_09350 [Elusimicrobiales bacterium]|nr:hypothetical protein [Elusimicrobiales bacterium]
MNLLRQNSAKGVTFLEMTVASLVFMLFVGGIMGVWGSLEKQRLHVQSRAKLDAEAQLARAVLTMDISSSTNVQSWTGQDITLTYPDSNNITYSIGTGNQLLRYESATISTTTAALYLTSISSETVNGQLHLRCEFERKPFPKSTTTQTAAVDLWWQAL